MPNVEECDHCGSTNKTERSHMVLPGSLQPGGRVERATLCQECRGHLRREWVALMLKYQTREST